MNKLTIIMYHYVRELKNSRYPNINGLDTKLFINQIQYLMKHYTIISMEDVINSIENYSKIPEKSALLTFDDAYLDHYTNVFPILGKYKIQGSFFIPARVIKEKKILDVNKIHFVLATVDDKKILIDELKKLMEKYKNELDEDFYAYYKRLAYPSRFDTKDVVFIKKLLQVELSKKLRSYFISFLFEKYVGVDEEVFSRELYMNKEQLLHMLRAGMHIGSHGYDHYWWNRLEKEELENELGLSKIFLDELGVDMKKLTACYPYGSYNMQVAEMLKKQSYRLAVTTVTNIASTEKESRFFMPRLDTNDIPKISTAEAEGWYRKG